jgi:hypothetical protein
MRYHTMQKTLIAALLLLLFAASAAATPDAYALNQINNTHWYFESTQYDLAEDGTYTYQAFANNKSTSQNTVTYTLRDGLHQINSTHWYFKASKSDLLDGTHNYTAYANNKSTEYRILDVDVNTPPASITNLQNTTGNFWHNWTWTNPADADFNYTTIYLNGSWMTNTSNEYYNLTADAHNQSTISTHTVDVNGNMNSTWVNLTSIIPNNPITITNTSDWSGNEGENVYVDYDATDADSDTPTFSCNRTDLFADFSTSTGSGNWTAIGGTHYIDFGVSDGYGSTSNYTMTISAMAVTLLSQTPSTIYQNTTGNLNISYGISHDSSGLNNTSVSFIFRNYDHTLNDANHSIRPPANNESAMWNYDGQILRAANRNETLNFENNDTITGGDIYTWSGLDENNTRLTIIPVNSTYTIVQINGTIHDLAMEQMWYLDRTDMIDAPKTQLAIHKSQDVLIKFWDAEIFKGNYNFTGAGYTDTSLNSAPTLQPSNADPVSFYYLNSSYDPLGGVDPLDSDYAVYIGSLNATQWIDHIYSPGQNASYVRGLVNNALLHSAITTTETAYLYFKSNTPSSKPYYINITDASTGTNRTFGQTDVLWIGDVAPYTAHPYTPNVWFAFIYNNTSFDHKLYVADNNGNWGNGTLQSTNIEAALFPPNNPIIDHFYFNGSDDYDMNKTYSGTMDVFIGVSTDPDGGTVTHNLTLHYANQTPIAIINNTFTDADVVGCAVYAEILFNTSPYYSSVDEYTLKVVATDDEGETATTWLGVNFTLSQVPNKPTLVAPANGAVGTSTNPTLRVTVTDPDGDSMNVTFYAQGGTQIGSTQTTIANGSTASVIWTGRSYSTTYYWYAVAHDGSTSNQSDTWHFTTQATSGGGGGGGVTHDIAITGCTDWNGNAGTNASIDFGYINEDADSPTFTTNATEGTLDAATGIWTWATTAGDVGTYIWYFRVTNAYGNSDQCTVTITVYATTTPLNLDATTGNFWIDHTWDAVSNADGYNVSINSAWHNGTATHYLNTLLSPHEWSNITLASYNGTTGTSSFISDNVQIPNNPITITNYSDHSVTVGDNVTVDLDYTDLDGDTPTFSCSRIDLFTDFDTANGTGIWTTAANGTFEIDFGVSDGHGSTDNCTVTVQVGSITITESPMPIQMFALMFGMMLLLVFYSFIRVDENNYTHILTAFSGGVLSLLLGLEVFDGIDFYGDSGWLAECSTGWIGLFLCVFGGIIILYAAVHAIDVVRETSEKLR